MVCVCFREWCWEGGRGGERPTRLLSRLLGGSGCLPTEACAVPVPTSLPQVEKAHADVMNILLGVLDDGRCVCTHTMASLRCRCVPFLRGCSLCRCPSLSPQPPLTPHLPPSARFPPALCRLTDTKGRTVSFANTVIIMTSNLGAHALLEQVRRRGALHCCSCLTHSTALCLHC